MGVISVIHSCKAEKATCLIMSEYFPSDTLDESAISARQVLLKLISSKRFLEYQRFLEGGGELTIEFENLPAGSGFLCSFLMKMLGPGFKVMFPEGIYNQRTWYSMDIAVTAVNTSDRSCQLKIKPYEGSSNMNFDEVAEYFLSMMAWCENFSYRS